MPNPDVPLEARGVSKRYGSPFHAGPWALRDLDLAIPRGSITALVGPNGAGKSTLIRGWVGFERTTTGALLVLGADAWHDRGRAIPHVGYVPQAASLYRSLTVRQHIEMASSLRPRFDRAVAAARLSDLDIPLARRAGELSGGQQAQVGLALALATHADVLLLDEPLASLDPLARREFLHVLVDGVRADGRTAILSSHVITDVEAACDRLIVLGGGRIRLHDSIAAAVSQHRAAPPQARLAGHRVATFPDDRGEPVALWRSAEADAGSPDASGSPEEAGSRATLEQVVMGYLAAGRGLDAGRSN